VLAFEGSKGDEMVVFELLLQHIDIAADPLL
jgi:hypothetical protein